MSEQEQATITVTIDFDELERRCIETLRAMPHVYFNVSDDELRLIIRAVITETLKTIERWRDGGNNDLLG